MTRAALCLGLLVWNADSPCDGQERETASEEEVKEAHEPVSRLRAVALQNNVDFGIGSNDRTGLRLLIQPWQAEVGTGIWWRMKTFSALPVLYRPNANESEGGTFGLGDPEISLFWSPRKAGRSVLGVGPVVRFPLATDDALGSGKWSAGVTALAIARPGRWLFGVRTYNIWSFAGDEERSDVNQFLLHYILLRVLGNGWYVISAPVVTADWNAPSGDQWLVPIGGGAGKLVKVGRRGVDLQVSAFYNVIHPETQPHADWTLRIQLQFLFAS